MAPDTACNTPLVAVLGSLHKIGSISMTFKDFHIRADKAKLVRGVIKGVCSLRPLVGA